MNLKDYFQEQKNNHMSDTAKIDVYQDFIVKNMKSHYARKRSFLHIKSFAYSIIIMFFLFSVYGVYFFTDRYTEEYEGLNNSVQASYIAQVVEFNGDFSTENKSTGKRIKTSYIQDGDVITLGENAQLVCQINAGTKAKLIGPAKFSIQQIDKGKTPKYTLNIIQGDFIEMKSTQDKPSEKIQVTIKDKITVQQANGNAIDYQLIKSGEQHIVKNSGGAILVTTIDKNNKQTKTDMNSEQVLAISDNDIKLFDDVKKFADAIKTNDISQTFTFNSSQETISSIEIATGTDATDSETDTEADLQPIEELPLASLLNTIDESVDQEVSNDLGSLFSDGKKIVTEDQLQKIKIVKNEFFVADISKAIIDGDEDALYDAYASVEKIIAQIYSSLDIPFTKPAGATIQEKLATLKTSTLSIASSIKSSYTIPESYITDLTKFANQLGELAEKIIGGATK